MWDYEPEGFKLPSGQYLPDFWLPRLELWVEVKPTAPSATEELRCEQLCHGRNQTVVVAVGLPEDRAGLKIFCADVSESAGEVWWDGFWSIKADRLAPCIICNSLRSFYVSMNHLVPLVGFVDEDELDRYLNSCELAAPRSARFEFGR